VLREEWNEAALTAHEAELRRKHAHLGKEEILKLFIQSEKEVRSWRETETEHIVA
jgi:hypothetical protein